MTYNHYKNFIRINLIAMAAVLLLGGVAYAALQSLPNKLTGNTIQTATANLQISKDGSNYGSSQVGFNFPGIVPGGPAVPDTGNNFWVKNSGTAPLNLKLAVTSAPSNPDGVDLNKVNIVLAMGTGTPQTFTLQSLINASASGGLPITSPATLYQNTNVTFNLKASMDVNATNSASATIGNIDFAVTGTAGVN